MNKLHLILLLLAFSMTASISYAQAQTIKAIADSTTLTMGDLVDVTVEVNKNSHPGVLVDMPEPKKDYFGLELSKCEIDSTELTDGRIRLTYNMQFQAFYPSELLSLPPFRYALASGDTIDSQVLSFKVYPVELSEELGNIEDPQSLTIHPDAPPVEVPSRWYDYVPDWIVWVILGLVAIALIIVLFLFFRKNATIFTQRKPIPPYELAVQRLADLKEKKLLDKGQVKNYYTELIDIFRNYLEGRFGINAMEMPSKTILKKIRENKEIHLSATQMEQVLQLADFVKFAAANPNPEDGLRTFNTISSFVESTKPAPQPEEEGKDSSVKKAKIKVK